MPPCPTSSSISYRSPKVSPTTGEKLPGARLPYAPEPYAQPQTPAPDRVEQQDEAGEEPERRLLRARVLLHCAGHEPAERDHPSDDEHHPRPAEPEHAEQEGQHSCDDCDHEPG